MNQEELEIFKWLVEEANGWHDDSWGGDIDCCEMDRAKEIIAEHEEELDKDITPYHLTMRI